MKSLQNILVIRNDKLGDFMLAWPAFSLLKSQYPDATITALVPSYTQPMAELCPWIDSIIIDDQRVSAISDARHLAAIIKNKKFDAAITLFSELRVGLALWLAGVPIRTSPATKIYQLFYNRKLVQRRSRSEKPEHAYNVDLVRHFIKKNGDTPKDLQNPPFLKFEPADTNKLKSAFIAENDITPLSRLILVHPGSGGSAANLSIPQYAELIKNLADDKSLHFVITAGPGEEQIISQLSEQIAECNHTLYISTQGLNKHALFLSIADMLISGSTGVLHIAGALNIPTVAFYTNRRSATSLRWQTLNTENRRLAFSPDQHHDAEDMSNMDIVGICETIKDKYLENTINLEVATPTK